MDIFYNSCMTMTYLTDEEFLLLQWRTNFDPVIQRLCSIKWKDQDSVDDRIEELELEVEDLESEVEDLEGRIQDLEDDNEDLRKKIEVWDTLSQE